MFTRMAIWVSTVTAYARHHMTARDDAGASLVEYALLLALIAVVAVGALEILGNSVSNTLHEVGNPINGSTTTVP